MPCSPGLHVWKQWKSGQADVAATLLWASQGAPDGLPISSCAHHTILNIFELWMNDILCSGLHGRKLFESGLADAPAAQWHEYWIVPWTGRRVHDRHIPQCQIYWSRHWLNMYTYNLCSPELNVWMWPKSDPADTQATLLHDHERVHWTGCTAYHVHLMQH